MFSRVATEAERRNSPSSPTNKAPLDLMPCSFAPTYPPRLPSIASPQSSSADALTTPNTSSAIESPPPLPPNTTLHPLTTSLVPSYRRLLTAHLPIPYPPKFYALSTTPPLETGTLALCITLSPPTTSPSSAPTFGSPNEPLVIAAIQARFEPVLPDLSVLSSSTTPPQQAYNLYIQTLTTASPYRSIGLASHLLSALVSRAIQIWGAYRIERVYAHVWESNEEALGWYLRRGFGKQERKCEGYYRRLRPGGAWLVGRGVSVGEYLRAGAMGVEGEVAAAGKKDGEGGGRTIGLSE